MVDSGGTTVIWVATIPLLRQPEYRVVAGGEYAVVGTHLLAITEFSGAFMYDKLSVEDRRAVDALYATLSPEERIAQTFNVHARSMGPEEIVALYERCPFGAVFYAYRSREETAAVAAALQAVARVPVLGSADLVNGAGSRIAGCTLFPWQMAVGATDDETCAERMGRATATEGRSAGIHWTFGPIVDLSINIANSMMHTRAFGDDPDHVLRMSRAFIRGVQEAGTMVATAKHFPGDGIDDRDSHICTSVNTLAETEWDDTFGRVWRGVIEEGVACVMSGHIALPWVDPATDYLGPRPATLSSSIQIEVLRKRLGFQGVVISDAIPMIGFSAFAPYRIRVPLNIETGSDMILWPDPEHDIETMKRAIHDGILSEARIETAVKNVLALKLHLGLPGSQSRAPTDASARFQAWADEIGERSICIVRNEKDVLPLSLKAGSRVLTVTCAFDEDTRGYVQELTVVDEELRRRGLVVEHLVNPGNDVLNARAREFDAIFMNVHVMPRYGTTRLFGRIASIFWNSFWHDHEAVVFTSFGDPYKLYEMPYVPNYVLTFSNTPSSQRAAVGVWLGEIEARGKLPVSLPGYFDRQV